MSDGSDSKIRCFYRSDGSRNSGQDILEFFYSNNAADELDVEYDIKGIWGDDDADTLFCVDAEGLQIVSVNLSNGELIRGGRYPLDPENDHPQDIWGFEGTLYVVDKADQKAYAYRQNDGSRQASLDFNLPSPNPIGLWSDGATKVMVYSCLLYTSPSPRDS